MRHGKPEKNILLRDVLYTIEKQGKAAYTRPWFMGDAAELKSKGYDVVLSTNPVIGDLSDLKAEGLARVLNNIWCMGAEPKAVTVSVLLPEAFEELELRDLMYFYRDECRRFDLEVVGGHTETTPFVKLPVVTFCAAGAAGANMYNTLAPAEGNRRRRELRNAAGAFVPKEAKRADIVVIGSCADEAASWIIRHKRDKLRERFAESYIREAEKVIGDFYVKEKAALAIKHGAYAVHDVSQGGIFEALWDLSDFVNTGFKADMRSIPFLQHTIEFCEFFDIDPYSARSQGAIVAAVPDGSELAAACAAEGIPAAAIGHFTDNNDRALLNGSDVRYLNMPEADTLLKLIYE